MVRLVNKNNIGLILGFAKAFMLIQNTFTYIRQWNPPKGGPYIYALWHGSQFGVHGIPNRDKLNVLVSTSFDGEVISKAVEVLGYKTCRGSSNKRGAVSGTLHMIDLLKSGESCVITVDGPKGPLHSIKKGVIALSRETGIPIITTDWYSEDITFVKFPSWDHMSTPIGPCRLLSLFGNPIYTDGKTDEQVAQEIKESLLHLNQIAPEKYKEAKKNKLWSKKQ